MKNLLMAAMMVLTCITANGRVQDFLPSNDSAIWYRTGNEAYNSAITGSDVDMDVYCHDTLIGAYCYIQFDLSGLDTNTVLTAAFLDVTKVSTNPVQDFAGTHSDSAAVMIASRTAFYGLNNVVDNTSQDWSEDSLSFNTTGSELTSDSATGTDPFNAAGGRATNLNGSESILGGTNLTLSGAALNTFVQSRMDDNGLVTFMIDFETIESGRGFAFNTKESGLPGLMPLLTLNYSTNAVQTDPLAVTLIDTGTTATLANGIVSALIDKTDGQLTDLRKGNSANLLANGGFIYYSANGSVTEGISGYVPFTPSAWTVITNTPQRIEVSLSGEMLGCRVELHYALREGKSGFDFYTVWEHGPGDPEVRFDQLRLAIRCDPNRFTMAYAGPEKTGPMIEPSLLAEAEEIMDATYKLPMTSSYTNETGHTHDGYPVYSKYDWSQFMENHHIHGVAGDAYGLWLVQGSTEYCNGGPTKAYQTVHGTSTTPIFMWLGQSTHKGASSIHLAEDEDWTKLYGPGFIYANAGTNAATLWADAQNQADAEVAAWPPSWMDHDWYPVDRGIISGRLHVLGQSTSNALLVLSAPGGYWHTVEAKGYQFWTRAEADGSFTIPNVRPGNYSLYAEVPGVVGIMEQTNVTVNSGATNNLGTVEWKPARHERRLFRLGTPDLSAAEFRFGSEMRQYGLWWRYQEEQGTNDLDFVIGQSDPATDWYYALTLLPVELSPTNGIWVTPRWNLHFDVDEMPPAPTRLSIDLAGAMTGAFYVFVNGVNICPNPTAGIYPVNDSGIYRSATEHSSLQRFELAFDPSLLSIGTNTISFTVRGTSTSADPWNGTMPVRPAAGIMFDCIQLEAGDLITNSVPRFQQLERSEAGLMMSGDGGIPFAHYHLEGATNLTHPWTRIHTQTFDDTGLFSTSNQTEEQSRFYRIEID